MSPICPSIIAICTYRTYKVSQLSLLGAAWRGRLLLFLPLWHRGQGLRGAGGAGGLRAARVGVLKGAHGPAEAEVGAGEEFEDCSGAMCKVRACCGRCW